MLEQAYEYVTRDFGQLLGREWLQRIDTELWKFTERLNQPLHELFLHPTPAWREQLDAFLEEQSAAGYTVIPESRQELIAFLEGWASNLPQVEPQRPERLRADQPSAPPSLALEIAKRWYLNSRDIPVLRSNIEKLPARISQMQSQLGSGGRYAYMIPKNIAALKQELLTSREQLALLESQQPNLEKAYHELGFDSVAYGGFTPGEIPIGGIGIAKVGEAAARVGPVRGLESDPIIFDIALGLPGAVRLARAGIGLATAGRSAATTAPSGRVIDKSWKAIVEGTAQKTGTQGHQFRSYRKAIEMAKSGQYERVYLNRSYSTVTGTTTTPRRLPDVLGKRYTGQFDAVEVPSITDNRAILIQRNVDAMNQLPASQHGNVRIVPIR